MDDLQDGQFKDKTRWASGKAEQHSKGFWVGVYKGVSRQGTAPSTTRR
jgi:hypothetical protein